jgi:5'-nucleotidase
VRVLVTNDDGIEADGLLCLAEVVLAAGHDLVVAAPSSDVSGASCSLTSVHTDGRMPVASRRIDSLGDAPVWSLPAAPALITVIALRGGFGPPPDLVASGMNRGPNTGRAVMHSGTVGAALTAGTYGASALAVSVATEPAVQWATAAAVARQALDWLAAQEPGTVLNVNVPAVPLDALRGVRSAELAPFGTVRTMVEEQGEGYLSLTYADPDEDPPPDSDHALLSRGFATRTLLRPLAERAAWPRGRPYPMRRPGSVARQPNG